MSRARDLSRLSNQTNFTPDVATGRVGLGSENPTAKLNVAGIVSATAFYGDGSNLEGVSGSGIGTALADEGVNSLVYYADKILGIVENTTIDVPDTSDSNVAYTKYAEVSVSDGIDLIIADGDDFIPDILGISSDVQVPGVLAGNGGRVRADNFSNKAGTGAPNFPSGLTGTTGSFTGNVSVGGVLTYEDVTNIDSIGIITARSDVSIADKIVHTGDTNTAIRFPAADTFAVETAGSERLRIDDSGRFFFNESTSDLGSKYIFSGNESSNVAAFQYNNNTGTYLTIKPFEAGGVVELLASARSGANPALTFNTGGSERLRIDSSGRLTAFNGGTNQASEFNSGANQFVITNNGACGLTIDSTSSTSSSIHFADGTTGSESYRGIIEYNHGSDYISFGTAGDHRLRIDSSGNVGIATVLPGNALHVFKNGDGQTPVKFETSNATGKLRFYNDSNGWSIDSEGDLRFVSGRTGSGAPTRLAIDSSGRLLVGTTNTSPVSANVAGTMINSDGEIHFSRNNGTTVLINRKASDGTLVQFWQDGTPEGTISVSGSTVSYNGAHLSRWSQLTGGAARTEILRGSVLSNLDEMCEWGEEDNEQLNRMQVSDVEGDKNVSGVFQDWDDDDDTYTNDFYCAMTGDFVIRIAQGTTVARGDLLMSAGDGTAKPQADDIVRSKTIAKVTSTTVSETYADGSYCIPCVLMAC